MTATVVDQIWQDHIWIGFVLVAVTAAVWAARAHPAAGAPLVVRLRRAASSLYTLLRSYADDTGIPIADHLRDRRRPPALFRDRPGRLAAEPFVLASDT